MLPSPGTTLPARARLSRIAVPTLVVGSLIATAFATVTARPESAAAAAVGTYTIGPTAIALNQSTDPELGVITPTADAADAGMFGSQQAWPLLALHASLARNGHVITYGSPLGASTQNGVAYDDWDPSAGFGAHVDTASMHGYDSFCNSAVTLADGRLLMVSGQYNPASSSEMSTMLYDPLTRSQDMGADLAYKRWYVTALRLTDNRILLLGGGDAGNTQTYQNPDANAGVATTPEIGTGTGAWRQLPGAESTILFGARDNHWWYPRAFNAPTGGVVGFSGDLIWTLSTDGAGSTKQVGTLPFNPRVSGSQVMYAPGKILVAGGGQNEQADGIVANDDAAVVDVTTATPVVTRTASMAHRRNWLNLTVLPTGDVLANGGTITGTAAGEANSVKQVEIWNPETGTWRTGASAQRTRTYHQTALLLPSGGVLTAGGGGATYTGSGAVFGPENNLNAEMFYPSYLFTKSATGAVTWASRPAITAISGSATYGGSVGLTIGGGRAISSASLISVPTVTHDQNTDQRRIPLDITQNGATVTATLPGSVDAMPPGAYELTVVDGKGVPSAAQIITIREGAAGQVTVAPGNADA
ncbi:galactose oxidase-like domain-containing protein, partial [uncultured Amnibacterium sp.]|uniref:galactose oxidase-like domain-containing protein n=1 Tax=uncultured Amnibacterium sp. TaxID=1631851 RepID=UPI0035CC8450